MDRATFLAVECIKLALPEIPIWTAQDIVEFRIENQKLLRVFRASMLRYAKELNGELENGSYEDLRKKTDFVLRTEIVPALEDVRLAVDRYERNSLKRIGDLFKIVGQLTSAFFAGSPSMYAGPAMSVVDFLVSEMSTYGERRDALKRSGLYYLLKVEQLGR